MLFFNESPYLQLLTFQLLSIGQFIYLITVMPFETKTNNIMELINEGLVLFTAEILTLFTDYNPNPEDRYMIGWVVLSIIILVSIINMSLFFYQAFQTIRKISRTVGTAFKSFISRVKSMRRTSSNASTISTLRTSQTLMNNFNDTKSNFLTKSTLDSSIKSLFSKNSQQIKEDLRQTNKLKSYIDSSKTVRIDPIKAINAGQDSMRQNAQLKSKISTIRNVHQSDKYQRYNVRTNLDMINITDDEENKDMYDNGTAAKFMNKVKFNF
eukprot:403342699